MSTSPDAYPWIREQREMTVLFRRRIKDESSGQWVIRAIRPDEVDFSYLAFMCTRALAITETDRAKQELFAIATMVNRDRNVRNPYDNAVISVTKEWLPNIRNTFPVVCIDGIMNKESESGMTRRRRYNDDGYCKNYVIWISSVVWKKFRCALDAVNSENRLYSFVDLIITLFHELAHCMVDHQSKGEATTPRLINARLSGSVKWDSGRGESGDYLEEKVFGGRVTSHPKYDHRHPQHNKDEPGVPYMAKSFGTGKNWFVGIQPLTDETMQSIVGGDPILPFKTMGKTFAFRNGVPLFATQKEPQPKEDIPMIERAAAKAYMIDVSDGAVIHIMGQTEKIVWPGIIDSKGRLQCGKDNMMDLSQRPEQLITYSDPPIKKQKSAERSGEPSTSNPTNRESRPMAATKDNSSHTADRRSSPDMGKHGSLDKKPKDSSPHARSEHSSSHQASKHASSHRSDRDSPSRSAGGHGSSQKSSGHGSSHKDSERGTSRTTGGQSSTQKSSSSKDRRPDEHADKGRRSRK